MVPNGSERCAAVRLDDRTYPPSAVLPPEYTEANPDCAEAVIGTAVVKAKRVEAQISFVSQPCSTFFVVERRCDAARSTWAGAAMNVRMCSLCDATSMSVIWAGSADAHKFGVG
jgi:hypothetical protein